MAPDIEDINRKVQDIITREFPRPTRDECRLYKNLVLEILAAQRERGHEALPFEFVRTIQRKYRFFSKYSYLLDMFDMLKESPREFGLGEEVVLTDEDEDYMTRALRIKSGKSHSGINSITILMSPYPEYTDSKTGERKKQEFSCKYNCHYCPNDPAAPRSYLSLEPAVLRSIKNEFSVCGQMWDRMNGLYRIGHRKITKLEVIVEGGTVSNYPMEYRDEFARDIYYAANVYWDDPGLRRGPWTLEEEKLANQKAKSRVIGLTFETRPDEMNPEELRTLRRHGCTRVQLGVQHLDQHVLDKINRRCTTEQVKHAIQLLKDVGFKIDVHLMPNLPGSSVQKDRHMLIDRVFGTKYPVPKRYEALDASWEEWQLAEPDLSVDQFKIYPTAIVPFTEIEKWFKDGTYTPYKEADLLDLLMDTMTMMYPFVRCNRMIRDIPADYYHSADTDPSGRMRQMVEMQLADEGKFCMDIRNREVKGSAWDGTYTMFVRTYEASQGREYFISAESTNQKTLYGFVRLRMSKCPRADIFPELQGCAFIREAHCYGDLQAQDNIGLGAGGVVQHRGLGKAMIALAERIAKTEGFSKMSVIAGEGSKPYYAKLGYSVAPGIGSYMVKSLG